MLSSSVSISRQFDVVVTVSITAFSRPMRMGPSRMPTSPKV